MIVDKFIVQENEPGASTTAAWFNPADGKLRFFVNGEWKALTDENTQIQSDWNQSDNTKVDFIKNKPTPYTLPAATADALGGVKVGNGLSVTGDGTLSGYKVVTVTPVVSQSYEFEDEPAWGIDSWTISGPAVAVGDAVIVKIDFSPMLAHSSDYWVDGDGTAQVNGIQLVYDGQLDLIGVPDEYVLTIQPASACLGLYQQSVDYPKLMAPAGSIYENSRLYFLAISFTDINGDGGYLCYNAEGGGWADIGWLFTFD